MSLIIAVVQSAVAAHRTGHGDGGRQPRPPGRSDGGDRHRSAASIGVGVAALLPATLDAATLTPAVVHGASAAVQAEVAGHLHRPCSLPCSSVWRSPTASASSRRCSCPPGRLSEERAVRVDAEPLTA